MKDFDAITKSGARLEIRDRLFSRNTTFYGKAGRVKVIDQTVLDALEGQEEKWNYINEQSIVEAPELGKLLYVDYMNWWYLSTEIVSVEVFDD